VDLLLDPDSWRVLGYVVLCGDECERFLVFATADPKEDEIDVPSALLLLEDDDYYRSRSRSLRALLGMAVTNGHHGGPGELRDLRLAHDGTVTGLLVERDGTTRELEPAGLRVESHHVFPA
jgi:hypothetical protein